MAKSTCTSIRIEFSDGTVLTSDSPEHAESCWSYIASTETMAVIHGIEFTGKSLTSSKAEVRSTEEV